MDYLAFFTITHGTADFGNLYVAREHRVYSRPPPEPPDGFVVQDEARPLTFMSIWPLCVVTRLSVARAAIEGARPGLICMPRSERDDAVIVESWF